MLQLIEIDKLCPHPDNPRKDLGDLKELADSILANGILQNLTVVPYIGEVTGEPIEGLYRVVIGHRRLAAAKIAELKEVPCIVSDMEPKEQVATMLLENMQRSDLTVYEQAQGFQMLLNFGDSVGIVSLRTGFSETTVRRRIKLLELDQEKFKASVQRGATLLDYAELEKIEDIELRNNVLEKIGTQNFKWELQRAIEKEAADKKIVVIVSELEKFATQIKESNGMQYVKCYYASQDNNIEVPEDADTTEYFFVVSNYGSVTLYTKYVPSQARIVQDEKQKVSQERRVALDEVSKQAYQLRREFVREISNAKAKKNKEVIIKYSIRAILDISYNNLDYEEYTEFLGIKVNDPDDDEWNFDDIAEHITAQPERHLLVAAYLALDSENEHYYNWNTLQHDDNEELNNVYILLEGLGYQLSDEEQALRDGTHELFATEETNDLR